MTRQLGQKGSNSWEEGERWKDLGLIVSQETWRQVAGHSCAGQPVVGSLRYLVRRSVRSRSHPPKAESLPVPGRSRRKEVSAPTQVEATTES